MTNVAKYGIGDFVYIIAKNTQICDHKENSKPIWQVVLGGYDGRVKITQLFMVLKGHDDVINLITYECEIGRIQGVGRNRAVSTKHENVFGTYEDAKAEADKRNKGGYC